MQVHCAESFTAASCRIASGEGEGAARKVDRGHRRNAVRFRQVGQVSPVAADTETVGFINVEHCTLTDRDRVRTRELAQGPQIQRAALARQNDVPGKVVGVGQEHGARASLGQGVASAPLDGIDTTEGQSGEVVGGTDHIQDAAAAADVQRAINGTGK